MAMMDRRDDSWGMLAHAPDPWNGRSAGRHAMMWDDPGDAREEREARVRVPHGGPGRLEEGPFARGSDRRIIGHDGYAERYEASKGRPGKGAFEDLGNGRGKSAKNGFDFDPYEPRNGFDAYELRSRGKPGPREDFDKGRGKAQAFEGRTFFSSDDLFSKDLFSKGRGKTGQDAVEERMREILAQMRNDDEQDDFWPRPRSDPWSRPLERLDEERDGPRDDSTLFSRATAPAMQWYRRVHADLVKRLAPPFSRGPDESFELHKGKGDAKGKKGGKREEEADWSFGAWTRTGYAASGMAVREKNTFIEVGRSGPEEEVWPRVSTWAAGQGQEDFGKGMDEKGGLSFPAWPKGGVPARTAQPGWRKGKDDDGPEFEERGKGEPRTAAGPAMREMEEHGRGGRAAGPGKSVPPEDDDRLRSRPIPHAQFDPEAFMKQESWRDQERECTMAIRAFSHQRRLAAALAVLDAMEGRGAVPNVWHYTAAVNACARGSQWSKALELLGSMERSGVGANILTYNAAISACTKAKETGPALALLRRMDATEGAKPDHVSFSACISACTSQGDWNTALELLQTMKSRNIVPPEKDSKRRGEDKGEGRGK